MRAPGVAGRPQGPRPKVPGRRAGGKFGASCIEFCLRVDVAGRPKNVGPSLGHLVVEIQFIFRGIGLDYVI